MPANTPRGFPYPLPTEPVAEGAQAVRNLAEKIDADTPNVLAYTEFTANVAINGTTEAAANLIVQSPARTYTAKPILIEFYGPLAAPGTTWLRLTLWDGIGGGSVALGLLAHLQPASLLAPVHVARRLTPTAASHLYNVRGHVDAGAGGVNAGGGGSGLYVPGFIRISRDA